MPRGGAIYIPPSSGGGSSPVATYTIATVPAASSVPANTVINVSDAPAGDQYAASDGTNWRYVNASGGGINRFLGDTSLWRDTFVSNTIASYSAAGSMAVAGGVLAPTATGFKKPYVTTPGGTPSNLVVLCRYKWSSGRHYNGLTKLFDSTGGSEDLVVVYCDSDTSGLKIGQYVAGVWTEIASSTGGINPGTDHWIVLAINGTAVKGYRFASDPEAANVVPTKTLSASADASLAAAGARPGLYLNNLDNNSCEFDDLRAWTYGAQPFTLP